MIRKGMTSWRKVVMSIGATLAVIAIVFMSIPLKTVAYTTTEKYQDIETYTVQESYQAQENYVEKVPYQRTETYVDREPYNRSVPVDYVVTDTQSYSYFFSTGFDLRVWIKNTDVKSGTFSIIYNVRLKGGALTILSASQYVVIGETKRVQASYSGALVDTWRYTVTPPTKEVLDYWNVTKTRQVTEYRDEIRTRTVIKIREVPKQRTVIKERSTTGQKKVTLLDALLHY